MSDQEFNYISEEPKKDSSKDPLSFGHNEIVSTLEKIAVKCKSPFTIGLYGKWGSGKSTIVENFKENLIKQKVPVIIFDVWKHEGDALRRTFLREVHEQLQSKKLIRFYTEYHELNKRLDGNVTIINDEIKIKWKHLLSTLLVFSIFTLAIFGMLLLSWFVFVHVLQWISVESLTFKTILYTFLGSIPITIFLKIGEKFVDKEKEETKLDRLQDPHEFETEFNDILNHLKSKRIVIVFDNLDRVSGENAVKIISTIKTFLEPVDKKNDKKEVVFLIPCDVEAIRNHLGKIFRGEVSEGEVSTHADEYLRKFFNTIIWIPDFYATELEQLAHDKLIETKIKDLDNKELAALIILVFDQNPRQIIQFINILISNYLLLRERNIEGFNISSNVPQLAKFLLLIQNFSGIMDLYRNNLIYKLEESIDHLIEDDKLVGLKVGEFREFLSLTEHVYIDSLDVFFKFRITEFEKEFENISKLIKLIESNKTREVFSGSLEIDVTEDITYINGLNLSDKLDSFCKTIKTKIGSINNSVLLCKFINGLLHLTRGTNITMDPQVYREMLMKMKKNPEYLYLIEPSLLVSECVNKIENNQLKNEFTKEIKKFWIAELKKR